MAGKITEARGDVFDGPANQLKAMVIANQRPLIRADGHLYDVKTVGPIWLLVVRRTESMETSNPMWLNTLRVRDIEILKTA